MNRLYTLVWFGWDDEDALLHVLVGLDQNKVWFGGYRPILEIEFSDDAELVMFALRFDDRQDVVYGSEDRTATIDPCDNPSVFTAWLNKMPPDARWKIGGHGSIEFADAETRDLFASALEAAKDTFKQGLPMLKRVSSEAGRL